MFWLVTCAAQCSEVSLSPLVRFTLGTLGPVSSSTRTSSPWPAQAARCRGEDPASSTLLHEACNIGSVVESFLHCNDFQIDKINSCQEAGNWPHFWNVLQSICRGCMHSHSQNNFVYTIYQLCSILAQPRLINFNLFYLLQNF